MSQEPLDAELVHGVDLVQILHREIQSGGAESYTSVLNPCFFKICPDLVDLSKTLSYCLCDLARFLQFVDQKLVRKNQMYVLPFQALQYMILDIFQDFDICECDFHRIVEPIL